MVDAKYEVIKQIGSGAYGVVASAIDKTTNKRYAIKKVEMSIM
jgi:serine/threonine protein kinase